jgi:hypothetical protein
MPVPSVAEWEWLNWKFPRPVRAGETIYARWTLTQKRAPVGGAPTAIVVWRVDVHTADGALCAEGEVGASVRRKVHAARAATVDAALAPAPAPAPAPRRRRGRRPPAPSPPAEAAPVVVEVAPKAAPASTTGTPRRRRRRRSRAGSSSGGNGPAPAGNPAPEAPPPPSPSGAAPAGAPPGALSRVIKRLRRT